MGDERRFPLDYARMHGEGIVDAMRPFCERIEIAGSIRRGRADVKDIEIVAKPLRVERTNLLGEPELAPFDPQPLIDAFNATTPHGLEPRRVNTQNPHRPEGYEVRGPKYQALAVGLERIPVDLFFVLEPATWGAILFIRTGPHEWNRRAIRRATQLGIRFTQGYIERVDGNKEGGEKVPSDEEADVFRALRSPVIAPENRK